MSIQLTGLLILMVLSIDIVFGAPSDFLIKPECKVLSKIIDKKYPLTDPIVMPDGSIKYRIAIISDLDGNSVNSSVANTWLSYFLHGYLTYNPVNNNVSFEWDSPAKTHKFQTNLSQKGRSLELSELVTYNGQLITVDDKTGLVYIINNSVLIPWVIIVDGDGFQTKGFKNEWATVKGSKLYVGTHGREFVTKDHLRPINEANMWVKTINKNGVVKHLNWVDHFIKLRAAFGIYFPGYMIHESCVWSDVHNRWFFLPRKASVDPFNPKDDERKATNVLLSATSDFKQIKVTRVGEIVPNHGYASFKFIPGTNDTIIAAIKTQEEGDVTATFITAFTINGKIIYPETKVSDIKFEGFEFI